MFWRFLRDKLLHDESRRTGLLSILSKFDTFLRGDMPHKHCAMA